MTCTDCLHFGLCQDQDYLLTGSTTVERECRHFCRFWRKIDDGPPDVGQRAMIYHKRFGVIAAKLRQYGSGAPVLKWAEINEQTPIPFQTEITHWRPWPEAPAK